MARQNVRQPFTRLPVPAAHAGLQPVISDIYDQLSAIPQSLASQLQSQFDALKTQVTGAAATAAASGVSGGGASSSGGGSTTTPVVPVDPTTTATIIVDSHANRNVNYPVASESLGAVYLENDRQTIYYNNTIAWALVAGLGFGLSANKYNDLGTNDSGFVWYSTDNNSVYLWNGTAWILITGQTTLTGSHGDRISYGAGTVSGSTLTATSGPVFQSYWVGNTIEIGGSLFIIATYVDSTHVTVIGAPTSGATTWYFSLFPSINYPQGTSYIETDRQVLYVVGTGTGTCNLSHFTVTWVSGAFFNPYCIGQQIVVNGISYLIDSCTLTSIGLHTDSGVVATGLGWIIGRSSWFYELGTMHAGTSSKPTDLNPYSDAGFEFHDTTVLVQYYGVHETSFSASQLYFAWMSGVESMTYSAFTGRTFYASDAGYQVNITDYAHEIIWTGSQWNFAPGDSSKFVVPSVDGNPPSGGVWGLCDGSAYNVFEVTAGTVNIVNITTPNLTGDTFVRGGTYTGSVNPTSAPTFSTAGFTFTGTPATLTGSISPPTFTGTPATLTGTTGVAIFTGTPATLTGTVAAPLFTGAALGNHQHETPFGIGTTGLAGNQVFGSGGALTATGFVAGTGSSVGFVGALTSSVSSGTPTGTNSAPTLTMNSYTPSGTNSAPALVINSYTPAGTNSTPSLTMNSYTPAGAITGSGTVSAPVVGAGAPKSLAMQFYLRR